jgi:S1-C subfamily serine protease
VSQLEDLPTAGAPGEPGDEPGDEPGADATGDAIAAAPAVGDDIDLDEVADADLDADADADADVDVDVDGAEAVAAGEARPGRIRSRTQTRREWRTTERARRYAARRSVRFPIFTRSVLLWILIFALIGVSFGASGAFWWAHFNTQIAQLRDDTRDFEQRSQNAQSAIDAERNQALTQINEAIKPLSGFLSETRTIQLAQAFAPSVFFVSTTDDEGKASVGTAFALTSGESETLLLTSYNTVKAAAVTPGPEIQVTKGGTNVKAELWSTDAERDLALLRVPVGGVNVLEWAPDDVAARALGLRVFPVSGIGGNGASLTSGVVVDVSAAGVAHTSPVGYAFQGGPIVTPDGKVLAVASLTYAPAGFDPGEVHYAAPISSVCQKILACGGGVKAKKDKAVDPPPG